MWDLPSCRPTQMMFPGLAASRSCELTHGSFTLSRHRTGALTDTVLTRRGMFRWREKISTWPWLESPPPPAT